MAGRRKTPDDLAERPCRRAPKDASRTRPARACDWASRLETGRPLFVLRKSIRYPVPPCFGPDKNVLAWTAARISIESSRRDLTDFPGMRTRHWGTASLAEEPCPARRGLVTLDECLARRPAELFRIDDAPRCKCGSVRLPANGTMAVSDELEWSSDFIRDCPAKAASPHGHVEPSENMGARPADQR